LKLRSAFPVSR